MMGGFKPLDPAADGGSSSLTDGLTDTKIPKFDLSGNKFLDSSITETSTQIDITKTVKVENSSLATNAMAEVMVSNGGTWDHSLRLIATGKNYNPTGAFIQDGAVISASLDLSGGLSILTRANAPIRFYVGGYTDAKKSMTLDENGNVVLEKQIQIKGGVPGISKVLTSDAAGLATWQSPASATGWDVIGESGAHTISYATHNKKIINASNSGTIDATLTIGTEFIWKNNTAGSLVLIVNVAGVKNIDINGINIGDSSLPLQAIGVASGQSLYVKAIHDIVPNVYISAERGAFQTYAITTSTDTLRTVNSYNYIHLEPGNDTLSIDSTAQVGGEHYIIENFTGKYVPLTFTNFTQVTNQSTQKITTSYNIPNSAKIEILIPPHDILFANFITSERLYDTDISSEGLLFATNFNSDSIDGTTTLDSSGENNHGTVTGATWSATSGFNGGGAYNFDGINDNVNLGNFNPTGNTITLSAWLKPSSITGVIIGKSHAATHSTPFYKWVMYRTPNSIHFRVDDTTVDAPAGVAPDNQWSFVVCRYNGTNITIFVNGVEVTTPVSKTSTIQTSTTPVTIGSAGTTVPIEFHGGVIDEPRVYDRALSDDEIAQLYYQRAEVLPSYVSQKYIRLDANKNMSTRGGGSAFHSVTVPVATAYIPLPFDTTADLINVELIGGLGGTEWKSLIDQEVKFSFEPQVNRSAGGGSESLVIQYEVSTDNGVTWAKGEAIFIELKGGDSVVSPLTAALHGKNDRIRFMAQGTTATSLEFIAIPAGTITSEQAIIPAYILNIS